MSSGAAWDSYTLDRTHTARVTYQLGEHFEEETVVKRNTEDNFALEFSLYSPVLCLAKVEFNDDAEPLYLSRYIDFRRVAGISAQIL